ncbi:MAG: flagellar export protein FliJ [Oscillospiraceae bacterium]
MKRFNFTLEKLLDYKDQVLSKEKNDLAQLRAEKRQREDEKAELEEKLRLSGEEYAEKAARGMTVNDITMFKNFHSALIRQIKDKEDEISALDGKIAGQTNVVVEVSKDVNSLERLKDKQLEEYRFAVNKSEEQFIEEYVSVSSFRKAQ